MSLEYWTKKTAQSDLERRELRRWTTAGGSGGIVFYELAFEAAAGCVLDVRVMAVQTPHDGSGGLRSGALVESEECEYLPQAVEGEKRVVVRDPSLALVGRRKTPGKQEHSVVPADSFLPTKIRRKLAEY